MKALKTSALIVGGLVALFFAFVIFQMIVDEMAPDQTLARKSGLSIRECISAGRAFGQTEYQARQTCEERSPK